MEIQIQQEDGTIADCEYEYEDKGGMTYWMSKHVEYANDSRIVNYPAFTGKVRPKSKK